MALAQTAYEGNDAVLMAKVIALAAQISDFEKEEVMSRSLRGAIGAKSVDVLNYLIPQGADVKKLRAIDVSCGGQTSKEVLEILLAHGWDSTYRILLRDWIFVLGLEIQMQLEARQGNIAGTKLLLS